MSRKLSRDERSSTADTSDSAVTAAEEPKKTRGRKKKSSAHEKTLYCICRSTDVSGQMVACESCDDWFHLKCVKLTKTVVEQIETYYCPGCREKNPRLEVKYKAKSAKQESVPNCNCINCFNAESCSQCIAIDARCEKHANCLGGATASASASAGSSRRKQQLDSISDDDDDFKIEPDEEDEVKPQKKRGRKKGWRKAIDGRPDARNAAASAEFGKEFAIQAAVLQSYSSHVRRATGPRGIRAADEILPQCFGRGCLLPAAHANTKYCSHECGLAVAKERLLRVLPTRIAEIGNHYRDGSESESLIQSLLEQTRAEILRTVASFEQVENAVKVIYRWIERLSGVQVHEDDDENDAADGDRRIGEDQTQYCPQCNSEVSCRQLLRHIERCFAKAEKMVEYGAPESAPSSLRLYCDAFNPHSQSYCRRLRVVCPEHYKGEEEARMEVCGFPLVWDEAPYARTLLSALDKLAAADDAGSAEPAFCMQRRKKCTAHTHWLKRLLAALDLERLGAQNALIDLKDRENWMVVNGKQRGDVLSLLSHCVIKTDDASSQ